MTKTDPLVDFVRTRISEVTDENTREAYAAIAGTAIGCPGCGGHSGMLHACPGRIGRPDGGWLDTGDEYCPWANILRNLALIWRDHADYNNFWRPESDFTAFEICEKYDSHMYGNYNSEKDVFVCANCGNEKEDV